jgi:hypothetical protein
MVFSVQSAIEVTFSYLEITITKKEETVTGQTKRQDNA